MILWLLALYAAFYTILTLKNYRLAVGLFIVFIPAYLLRFQIGPIPSTLLEVNFLLLFFVWLGKYSRADLPKILFWLKNDKKISVAIALFLLSATISIFVGNQTYADPFAALLRGLGVWRAYFIEPAVLFFVLLGRVGEPADKNFITQKFLVKSLIFSTISVSLLAIAQQFNSSLSDPSLWNDNLNGRAASFFTSPNAIGLFVAPIIPLMAALFFGSVDRKERKFLLLLALLAVLAILFSFSEGAWVALGAGLLVFAALAGWKKIFITILIGGCLFLAIIPKLQKAVFFEDKAGQNRLELWNYTADFLGNSPQNFIFGAGLRKFFHQVQKPAYDPAQLERLNYPHNFFLNFWSETGLLGALSFCGLLFFAGKKVCQIKKEDLFLGAGLAAALTIIVVHGLVDVPYFKNDLSMIFWLLLLIIFTAKTKPEA